jgi:methyl-accepting chemotaxis protein
MWFQRRLPEVVGNNFAAPYSSRLSRRNYSFVPETWRIDASTFLNGINLNKQLTIKRMFGAALVGWIILAILFGVALYRVGRTQARVGEAADLRYHSYLLADELRQSSDDLTRLARTYVVTAEPKYEQQYQDILDVRGGKKPRADGRTIALTELMKRAGFSDQEFAKLKESQDNSDGLVKTEVAAMNAVKGLFDDGSGQFTRKGEPDLDLARTLMHDEKYHQYKARIMKPLDEFFVLLDQRTAHAVDEAQAASRHAYAAAIGLLAFSVAGVAGAFLFMYRRISGQLGAEPAEAQRIANEIAEGRLNVEIVVRPGDRGSLLSAMLTMRDNLAGIIGNVRAATETIAGASGQIAHSSQDLSSRTEQQASSLEETAASMEELTSTVKQNADNARQANQLAMTASAVAVKGGGVVAEVVGTMGSINDSSKKIVDIISVIDGIAFQTNILALNAAVEAARAGEQGRGFAVVASEVRNLAQRSAAAAKEIKALIGDSVEKVGLGSELVQRAGATMDEIVDSVRRVTDIMGEIMAASQEQSSGIEQVNQAVAQMDQVTQQNAALVEEAAAAASAMQQEADRLSSLASVFSLGGAQSRSHAVTRSAQAPRLARTVGAG